MRFQKVLVVDDSPTELHMVVDILNRQKIPEVITATNGLDAVAKSQAEMPDLILMDVVMPEMNGFQATRKIKKNPETSEIPVIIISSKDQETDKVSVSYTHLTLPTTIGWCRSRWSPYH